MMSFLFCLVILLSRIIHLFIFSSFIHSFLPSTPLTRIFGFFLYTRHYSLSFTGYFTSSTSPLPSLCTFFRASLPLFLPLQLSSPFSSSRCRIFIFSRLLFLILFALSSTFYLFCFYLFLPFFFFFFFSSFLGQRTEKLFEAVDRAAKQFSRRIPTAIINEVVQGKGREEMCIDNFVSTSTITLLNRPSN